LATDIGTLALGTYTNVSNTAIQGSDPVLEVIASLDDADYVYDATNTTHEGRARFALADMPVNFGTMATLNVRLRYHWAAGTQVNTWNTLSAQVFKSDNTTALTNKVTVASSITTTSATNSSVISLTGLDTDANKTDWDGAFVHIFFSITKVKGGDTIQKRVTAGELTGTYEVLVDNKNVTPGLGELLVTGFAAVVFASNLINVSPDVGELTLTGFGPLVTLSDNKNIAIGLGELSLDGFAPSIVLSDNINIIAGLGELLLEGYASTVGLSDNKNITAGLGELVLTGYAPIADIPTDKEVFPSTGELTITGFAPDIFKTREMYYWNGASWVFIGRTIL